MSRYHTDWKPARTHHHKYWMVWFEIPRRWVGLFGDRRSKQQWTGETRQEAIDNMKKSRLWRNYKSLKGVRVYAQVKHQTFRNLKAEHVKKAAL